MGFHVKAAMLLAVFFLPAATYLFSQDEALQRGSIPEELLRPRRDESPRYPIDTVIGELGQGKAPKEAYDCARRAAAAFLAGTMNAPVFSSVNRVFLESCMSALNAVNPRYFRLGGGREEPDGSVSFLVRFAGREEGITGELFIRREQRRIELAPPPPAAPGNDAAQNEAVQNEAAQEEEAQGEAAQNETAQGDAAQNELEGGGDGGGDGETAEVLPEVPVRIETTWVFEDIILEEPRSREAENEESRHRFDFPPYERIF